nr:hypothetical protein [Tanacetum cinerariifolium]GEZ83745.1 hypothetical protein [Tanacetum cinerariifolium]
KWRYLIPAKPPIHNHVLIPNYQDFKIQDFCYSDGFECFQAIKIGRIKDKIVWNPAWAYEYNATKDDNQSVGRLVAASRGGGTGGRAGRGGVRARGHFGDQDSSEIGNRGSQLGSELNDGVNEVPDFPPSLQSSCKIYF